MKTKKKLFNTGAVIALLLNMYAAYCLLLCNYCLNISSILTYAKNLTTKQHLLVLGLLPVYISAVIFGAAILGLYLGTRIENLFARNKNSLLKAESKS